MAYNRNYFRGGQVTTPQIIEGAVTEDKIADNAVTSPKIKNATIQTEDIADGAVTLDKLGSDVPAVGIADLSITTAKLATEAVTREKINDQAVDSLKIKDGAVTNAKIVDGAVTNAKIATNTITQGKIANNAIGTGEIQNGAVTAEKLAPGVGGGDRFVWGVEGQTGNPRSSAEVMYLTGISADIPYTSLDLSAWIPANAKGIILQLGMFNQAYTSGRAFFRVRTNTDQRDALGVGNMVGLNSMVANGGIVPLVQGTGPRTIEYALESVGGPWVATFTLYITVVGYIM